MLHVVHATVAISNELLLSFFNISNHLGAICQIVTDRGLNLF